RQRQILDQLKVQLGPILQARTKGIEFSYPCACPFCDDTDDAWFKLRFGENAGCACRCNPGLNLLDALRARRRLRIDAYAPCRVQVEPMLKVVITIVEDDEGLAM